MLIIGRNSCQYKHYWGSITAGKLESKICALEKQFAMYSYGETRISNVHFWIVIQWIFDFFFFETID